MEEMKEYSYEERYKDSYVVFCISVYPHLADEFYNAVRKLNGVNQIWEQDRE
tara:strand:- start:686 stop:841 length:156 start_codon:yes stop_codon:yes gene_type:complete